MGFSPKRAKALKEGRLRYFIYDSDGLLCGCCRSFIAAVQTADLLQKTNPGVEYTMKLEEVSDGEEV